MSKKLMIGAAIGALMVSGRWGNRRLPCRVKQAGRRIL